LRHVFSEAARVERFREILTRQNVESSQDSDMEESKNIHELGRILSASHASLRDQYECSCFEVDDLVESCLRQGSVGSRITGAGWGGCVLNLVPQDKLSGFVDVFGALLGKDSVFEVVASAGASVLSL
jgi:galactokinase